MNAQTKIPECVLLFRGNDWHHGLSLELLSTVTFAEQAGKTLLTVQWLPLNATDRERKTFDEAHESMKGGWNGTFDRLAEYLAEAPKGFGLYQEPTETK